MQTLLKNAWTWVIPLAGLVALVAGMSMPVTEAVVALVLFGVLLGAVLTGVHHAEVVAHRVGEPFGTLVLALAITVIEASLIVSLMMAGGEASHDLARNTLLATIMIICNGVVGVCLLLGAARYSNRSSRCRAPALPCRCSSRWRC